MKSLSQKVAEFKRMNILRFQHSHLVNGEVRNHLFGQPYLLFLEKWAREHNDLLECYTKPEALDSYVELLNDYSTLSDEEFFKSRLIMRDEIPNLIICCGLISGRYAFTSDNGKLIVNLSVMPYLSDIELRDAEKELFKTAAPNAVIIRYSYGTEPDVFALGLDNNEQACEFSYMVDNAEVIKSNELNQILNRLHKMNLQDQYSYDDVKTVAAVVKTAMETGVYRLMNLDADGENDTHMVICFGCLKGFGYKISTDAQTGHCH